jgi:fatty acid CoA ligase FadD9
LNLYFEPRFVTDISEREVCTCVFVNGGRVGIASSDHALVFEDILMVSPSRLDSTPRFWNVIYQQYKTAEQIEESIVMAKTQKSYLTEEEKESIAKKLKEKFRAILGTRCRSVSMGGAAVSQDLKQFMKLLFPMIQVREGYGTTEAGAIADDTGRIHQGIEFKLTDVPQLGYTNEDKPFPRGELCVRTSVTIQGYYGNEADTASAFDSEGYFRTGDVVELIDKRKIRIIDRVKNFFKLSQGEYISAEPIENVYLQSPWVDQVFIGHADLGKFPSQMAVLAAIVPQQTTVRKWLNASDDTSFAELCAMHADAIKRKLLEECRAEAQKAQLREMEIPCGIVVDPQQWSVENGLLTSSYKLCRPALRTKYQPLLDAVYEAGYSSMSSDHGTQSPETEASDTASDGSGGKLLQLLQEVLGLAGSSNISKSTVKSLGGDSLSAIRLSHVIKSQFNINVDAGTLINMSVPELEDLLAKGESSFQSDNKIDFETEAILPADLLSRISSAEPSSEPGGILITGATGFVGSHIVMDLILHMKQHPEQQRSVYVLIRSPSIDLASQRLTDSLRNLSITPNVISISDIEKYVNVVPGDLDTKRLGLPESIYRTLSGTNMIAPAQ